MRYTKYSLIFVCLLLTSFAKTNEKKLEHESIPESLKSNSQSVFRYFDQTLEVKSESEAILKLSYAVTILNKNGLEDSYFKVGYDKNTKVRNISGSIYDSNGEKIKDMRGSEIEDFSAISGYSIFDDSRVKVYDPEIRDYPFTVDYSFELHIDGYISLPGWEPYFGENIGVERTSFKLIYPQDMSIRYLENQIEKVSESVIDKKNILIWEVSHIPAIEYEPFMPPYKNYGPYVAVAPNQFQYDAFPGNANNWQSLGEWANKLNKGRDIISEETINEVNALISESKTDYERVRTIYKYLQDNTRYVSVQLGIGGFQPFEAEKVERLKYGDCKALTNYMLTLLKTVGIESYYTWVAAGPKASPTLSNFPSDQFNHVFLCVPIETDTLWLECTSQQVPCGYIGDFTDDRDVLVIGDNGGTLVRTPGYSAEQNRKVSKIAVDLYDNGNASVKLDASYYGPYMSEIFGTIGLDNEGKEKHLYNKLDLAKAKINSFKYSIEEDYPFGKESVQFDVGNLATKMGNNLFLMPNVLSKIEELSGKPEDRLTDIFIRRSISDVDTVIFNLQESIILSSLPEEVIHESDFGSYRCSVKLVGETMVYTRYFKLNAGTYPKERINEFYEFADKVHKSDKQRIALKLVN